MRIAEERDEDDESEEIKANKFSHEQQKIHIFEQLGDMAYQMRSFTADIESRLDKVYSQGAPKKFGFSEITNSADKELIDPDNKSESDQKIERIASAAKDFMKKNN